ncbi:MULTISPECIES: NADPH-dependent FMN reductase [Tenacibaculum]|uniref:NADPH-dependent FMN reductase n=1 Tax=Tenacibaculum TaxID=104267 RepID=UPI001F0B30A9|nr:MULTISPECIES: NAD(P)H-dependent oxidoreductase [Tenacibaculum]MCH3883250.1 NAD(P)H-dependent oxidoreductase [Tenacibaculum aquimarinum]MCH3884759.1 NAD(P)H-dependent oxidoreductase [Tenacibaculum aquimarinum]MDO6600394.1 NAD(P)H-dependent oxidoreductase [Tenacibaculum sp. 1_MG-2023]
MKNIIAFAGSNSKNSINKQLATYTSSLVENVAVQILDLNDFPLPIYGIDEETEKGIPANANKFLSLIESSDGIIVSLAEHNGSYTVAFKNLLDWMSRIDKSIFKNKPMLLMATSPGARGGKTVLETAKNAFPRFGANLVADFSLPSFFDNFKENEITNEALNSQLKELVAEFKN